jgi:hypothetical protein
MSELQPGIVTVADIYREVIGMRQDVGKALVRIEVIDARNHDADKIHADHETRIRALESFRWKLSGIAIALSIGGGYVGYLLGHLH